MKGHGSSSRANANNHSNQLNPNNPAYWSSRGASTPSSGGSSGNASPPTASPPPTGDTNEGGQVTGSK